jgi:hypothetical protein
MQPANLQAHRGAASLPPLCTYAAGSWTADYIGDFDLMLACSVRLAPSQSNTQHHTGGARLMDLLCSGAG